MIDTHNGEFPEVPSLDLLTLLFDSPHVPTSPETPLHAFADHPTKVLRQRHVLSYALQTAAFLKRHLLTTRSPVISVLSTGHPILPSLFFAILACGAIYNPISPDTPPEKISTQLGASAASLFVCSADMAPLAREAVKLANMSWSKVWVYDAEPGVVGIPKPILHPLPKEGSAFKAGSGATGCDYETQAELPDWERITDPGVLRNTPVCLLYTSGTTSRTGCGKGVLISHANLVAETFLPACLHRPVYKEWSTRPALRDITMPMAPYFCTRTLGHLPPAHISGIQLYFVNSHFDAGIVYWMRTFDFSTFLNHSSKLRITYIFTAVPIYGAIAQLPREKARAIFGHLKMAFSGGAHLPNKIFKKVEQRLGSKVGGVTIGQVWGATEATGVVTYHAFKPHTEESIGSVGRLLPGCEMKLVDHCGKDVPKGFPGEAWLRGPTVSIGYHNNSEANEASFTHDGWYKSGDVLSIQEETGLIFVGPRKKELIRTSAGPVSPFALESLLLSHPLIMDAAVIGVPGTIPGADENARFMPFDACASEVPRAYVVLADGDVLDGDGYTDEDYELERAALEEDVVSFVSEILPEARHMWLDGGVEFVPALPRNTAGKVLRWKLRDMYLSRMGIQDTRVDELVGALDIDDE